MILKNKIIPSAGYSISSLNETALLVSFDPVIDEAVNEKVIALHDKLAANPFRGFCESVPSYHSLAVFYDAAIVKKEYAATGMAFDIVEQYTRQLLEKPEQASEKKNTKIIAIPVHYNGADLQEIAKLHHISTDELVMIHTAKLYRVFMIGFQPGFAYMGKLDEAIATPRKTTPRTKVPAGSIGIAGMQTGIYPFTSPGGWQLVGRTPLKIFDKEKKDPCLLKAGDHVQFVAISKQEFEKKNEHQDH